MANSLKFGTSGLRGLAVELIGDEARRYARAFVAHLQRTGRQPHRVLIGRDLRPSSAAIARSVAAGIAQAGAAPVDCGEVPTPALAFIAMGQGAPSIMVTGSHIPADRNGLKFYSAGGEIDKADEAGIVAALAPAAAGAEVEPATEPGTAAAYLARYARLLPAGGLKGWRVGVWQHSSVARDLFVEALRQAGAEPVPLGRTSVFVPVDTEAVSAGHAAQLADWVRAERLDALVSTDGDADRPLLVDETGALLRGDVIGVLSAAALKAKTVVTPVTSNSAIEGLGWFDSVVRTKVGSPYVIAGMAGGRAPVLGFEANGGVLLGSAVTVNGAAVSALPTRDALLPLLLVLGLATARRQTVSQLVATLPPRHARSGRLEHVAAEDSARLMARLKDDAAGFLRPVGTLASVSDIDGLRHVLETGEVIHYRPSGNAPELRCYTEAATGERADELLAWGLGAAEAVVR